MTAYNQDEKETNENRDAFKRALSEVLEQKMREEEDERIESKPPSKRHKIRMNRIFRENGIGSFLSFPEADNLYERLRGKLIAACKRKNK